MEVEGNIGESRATVAPGEMDGEWGEKEACDSREVSLYGRLV